METLLKRRLHLSLASKQSFFTENYYWEITDKLNGRMLY